jgi:hypothetical protein
MEPAPNRPEMKDEELQSAADHIRMGNNGYDPDKYATLTVTEGIQNGHRVYTVTSSRGFLIEDEWRRAVEVFGLGGFDVPRDAVSVPKTKKEREERTDWHAEQRGIRTTQGQTKRRQASSNITPDTKADPDLLHMGAACRGCEAAQTLADVANVTGTVRGGGRTNKPYPSEWKRWKERWIP